MSQHFCVAGATEITDDDNNVHDGSHNDDDDNDTVSNFI